MLVDITWMPHASSSSWSDEIEELEGVSLSHV